ncbi:DUF2867 domain-containing protein [Agromyces sp. SYSU K20354]|uniref:DUF2867 domain-containing protein n=1 Tax=Agromyces cavernae TaxID=2898659 RepID=UPI001E2AA8DD|nr:DUF2867 domain-containing protein [Agromyces cavernae]MCD2442022.1 DUF2867 domain-containing protein [Agromyces cavernae]
MTRLPISAHLERPWRIHEFAPEFDVEDVWSFRTPGAGADDFDAMVDAMRDAGGPGSSSRLTRALFALRWRLGALFGWDDGGGGLGARVTAVRDRLPEGLRQTVAGEPYDSVFIPAYRVRDELASELANRTVHTIMHLGWVPGANGYELRMAVLVRPNGLFGRMYLAAILPFRYLIVYPSLTRQWEGAWRARKTADGGRVARLRSAELSAPIRLLGDPDADAVDAVAIRTAVRVDPVEWASALLDGLGDRGQFIWRRVLGLRLSDLGETDTVAGWPIVARDVDWVRLEASSKDLTGQLVISVDGDTVTLATFVRYRRMRGRIVWQLILPMHRVVTARLLRDAPAGVSTTPRSRG